MRLGYAPIGHMLSIEGADEVLMQEPESHNQLESSTSSSDDDDYHNANAEIFLYATETTQTSRYPSRQRRKPPGWYIANTAKCSTDVTVRTSDEPTLGEAMSATPEEREMWLLAIDNEFDSLESKETWQLDDSPKENECPANACGTQNQTQVGWYCRTFQSTYCGQR